MILLRTKEKSISKPFNDFSQGDGVGKKHEDFLCHVEPQHLQFQGYLQQTSSYFHSSF